MKLNPDCVRNILLDVEVTTDYHHHWDYTEATALSPILERYSHEEILYHIKQCELSKLLIDVSYLDGGKHVIVGDLGPDGHKFLANVRQDNIWNGTKKIAEKIGSRSLDVLVQVASNVITELIKAQFGIGLPAM